MTLRSVLSLLACASVPLLFPPLHAQEPPEAVAPDRVIDLIAEADPSSFTVHLNEDSSLTTDREEIWYVDENGHLQVTGKGMGYIRTNRAWRDYHLVIEFRWGERTLATRADRARDCGLLLHAYGPDGAYGNTWMSCIEAQMIEGGNGDLLVLAAEGEDGEPAPTRITAEVTEDRDGEPVWTPGAEKRPFPADGKTMGRVNWKNRDPDWEDVKGFRGENDLGNPVGEWNRMEVICEDDRIRVRVNGELVNEATDCHPAGGFIGLQSEYAECEIRRLELHPLGTFEEKWEPEVASTDTGYSVTGESLMPRDFPLSPEDSAAKWHVDGDYELQLVAAEPLTCDPVDVAWDAAGRMYVAEMGDYPLPVEDGKPLSRIRLLTDENGDGVMDDAVTWADHLDHVQGLVPYDGGLLATTRTAILHLVDTDGDDRADVREKLFVSNEPRHSQLLVSSPRWALDNHLHFNNGLSGKEIYPAGQPDDVVEFDRLNLRWDPRGGPMEPITGRGQYGAGFDDFGRHFFCTNRNPAIFAVMPLEAVQRTPLAAVGRGQEDIQSPGAPVHPVALSHTTSSAHAGTHTAACGLGVYRGGLTPELTGDLFVCDPTAQLVTRNRLAPDGASFEAERVAGDHDFLASGDEWTRPVQVRNGPDGALYVCDMYRRFIDHSRFFPEDFTQSHYMRAGLDQGRIWRLVPKGKTPDAGEPLPEDDAKLVECLAHRDGWRRTHAQRLLVKGQDESVVPAVERLLADAPTSQAAAHALWTLAGLDALDREALAGALRSTEGPVAENALQAAANHEEGKALVASIADALLAHDSIRVRFLALSLFPDIAPPAPRLAALVAENPGATWLRKAVMSAAPEQGPEVLVALLGEETLLESGSEPRRGLLEDFARLAAAGREPAALAPVLERLDGEPSWWHFAVATGLSTGIRQSPGDHKSLAALLKAEPPALADGLATLRTVIESATEIALDTDRPEADRLAALPLVGQQPWEEKAAVVEQLIRPHQPPAIQSAACRLLRRGDRERVQQFFFERWDKLAPTPLREAIDILTANANSGLALMKKMKAGEISPSIMPPMKRWSYGRSSNEELKSLAKELFGQTSDDRAAVIDEYRAALGEREGDPARGRELFVRATCATCHKVGDVGVVVGPPLDDVSLKPPQALLTDILDPNRAIEERWVPVTVETTAGRQLTGLVQAEDSSGVTISLPGGSTETIPRASIESLSSNEHSLMPVGLEAAISPEEMVDLLAFLKKKG